MERGWMDFLAMSGYAQYVWSAFGITLFAMLLLWLLTRAGHRRALADIQRRNRIDQQAGKQYPAGRNQA